MPILQFLQLLFFEGFAVQFIILYTVGIEKNMFYCYVNSNFSDTRNWDGTHAVGTRETFLQEKTAKRQSRRVYYTGAVCIYRRRMYNKQIVRFIHILNTTNY